MHTNQDWDGLAQMRRQELDREMRQLQLLALLPPKPARWKRWTGRGMARFGRLLMHWGKRVAMAENRPQTSPAR